METKTTEKPINVLNMNSIILEKPEAMVKQMALFLHEIVRNGNEITLNGVRTLTGKEAESIKTSVRAIQYLNTKSVKRVHPFGKTEFERLLKQTEGKISLKPAYPFYVNVLVHHESSIGYALTFKKLVALNNKIFEAYLKGETPKTHQTLFPYFLGETTVNTPNGEMRVHFGNLNGNCGIKLTNANKVQVGVSYKHLPNSISAMCAQLNKMVKNENMQTAQTSEEMAQILETFKGNTM